MNGFAITSRGLEETASAEIVELINSKCKIEQNCVLFDFINFKDLCLLCYKAQSADRVLYLIDSFEFKDFFKNLENSIMNSDFSKWIDDCNCFKFESIRLGLHDFRSVDVEEKAAKLVIGKTKNRFKVDIRNPDIIFLVYIVENKCYFGVDFTGFAMNKRGYKIFLSPNSLRGTVAYALLRESGFEKNEVVLDPFSRDGVIAIEAAFYLSDFPLNYYNKNKFAFLKLRLDLDFEKFFKNIDKKSKKTKGKIFCSDHLFKYVDYSRKNAKIAGVDKQINFGRIELEWLDIKFKKESVDRIITNPPASKNANLDKIYNEFFYQSSYILKKNGTISIISRIPDFAKKSAEKHNFQLTKEMDVYSGTQLLKIMVFKKKKLV